MFYQLAKPGNDWKEKLNLFVALAPVTRLDHSTSEIMVLISWPWKMIRDLFYLFRIYHIFDGWQAVVMQDTCRIFPSLCLFGEGFLITQDPSIDDPERFNVYMGHFPAASSVQSLVHFGQLMHSKQVQLYDWGTAAENYKHYDSRSPPLVDYTNIKGDVPIAMFVGTADNFGNKVDARWARDTISSAGNAIKHY